LYCIEETWLLPDDRPRSIATALALGAASSSCSYAAVALARSLFRKGAHFTAAMAFEMASTNLVLELSIIIVALLGWQLTLAEFVGAPLMVVLLILLFRMFLSRDLVEEAKEQADMRTIGSRARDKLIDEATKPRNRSPISARYYKFESISLQRGEWRYSGAV